MLPMKNTNLPVNSENASFAECDHPDCVFCSEFTGQTDTVFQKLTGKAIPTRILRQTGHFVVFPPLGQFIEGGLLLASREHLISFACLPECYYDELEDLVHEIGEQLLLHFGCMPVFFEHAPLAPGDKGTCCVDHAHLNIFPVRVDVHEHLSHFPHCQIHSLKELAAMPARDGGYLFLQNMDGRRYVYQAGIVPSQYVRRIITAKLGIPERWHWRDYLGLEELKRTMDKLSSWSSFDDPMRL
jgi:hypothetical protein